MSDDDIVGHKTFSDGALSFRHEPLTRKEANELMARADAEKAKRASDMPTDQDAVNALWSAMYRLEELGWHRPNGYAARDLRQEDKECQLVELGSSGIHVGYYHPVNGKDVWWIGPHGSPSEPCLVKPLDSSNDILDGNT